MMLILHAIMKKPIIACILTALLSIVAIGQNLKKDIDVELGPSFKLAKRAFHMDIIPLENGEFIAVEGVGRSARKEFDLIHFNAKMKEINRSTIELKVGKDLHGYEKLYYKNGELVLFTSLGNKKADFSKLFYQKIQLKTLKPTKQIIQVDEAVSKRGTSPFIINFSSDGSKLLVYKSNSVDKDEPLSYGVKILNAAGNLSVIWEKDLVSELSSELEDIKKIGVNNKGDVFLSSLQYKGKRKAVVNNEPKIIIPKSFFIMVKNNTT